MKKLILTLAVVLGALWSTAQITIDPYQIEMRVSVDEVEKLDAITATSACGEISVSVKLQQFSGGCLGNTVRTFTFTDGCGNTETAQQFLILTDDVPPVFDAIPESITASKDDVPAAAEVTATDNSGKDVEITMTEVVERKRIIRTWTAEDQCGNKATKEQVISLK
ncbi:hypothetical protein [Sanyastnella coralliicola]|uniref:hypothetical protein n=1 Tax=Sanyastnella coralliicola TaxID=3069118 RepID=UPI0027BAC458|nr:hypothetical protein [Longitalea sp. SCSIO 12813]